MVTGAFLCKILVESNDKILCHPQSHRAFRRSPHTRWMNQHTLCHRVVHNLPITNVWTSLGPDTKANNFGIILGGKWHTKRHTQSKGYQHTIDWRIGLGSDSSIDFGSNDARPGDICGWYKSSEIATLMYMRGNNGLCHAVIKRRK